MITKYLDSNGRETVVQDQGALAYAIRSGQISGSTLVQVHGKDQWVTAESLQTFRDQAGLANGETSEFEESTAEVPVVARRSHLALVGLAMGIGGVLLYLGTATLIRGGNVRAIGYAVGTVVGTVVRDVVLGMILSIPVFWLIKRAGRPSSSRIIAVVVGAIILVELGYRSGSDIYKMSYSVRVLGETKAAVDQLKQGAGGSAPASSGDTEFKRWLDSYIKRNQEIQADQQAAMGRYGVASLLSPDSFHSAETISAARKNAISFRDELDVSQQRYERLLDGATDELAALNIPAEIKDGMLRGLRETGPKTKEQLRAYFTLEKEFMKQVDDLLYFVGNRYPSGYKMQGQQIFFVEQADVTEFNRKMALILDTVQKEGEMRQAMMQQFQAQTDILSKIPGK